MARLPYTPEDIAVPAALVAELRARRGGNLLDVERMMLHSPTLATAWNGFFSTIKTGMQLSPHLRELIACAVGAINSAPYLYRQHAAAFLAAGGTSGQLQGLALPDAAARDADCFSLAERSVLQMCLEMSRAVTVSDATFAQALAALGCQQTMVEMVAVIASYNLVSRFLVALEIGAEQVPLAANIDNLNKGTK
jgi:alkylhydroperoxidase family enzyme